MRLRPSAAGAVVEVLRRSLPCVGASDAWECHLSSGEVPDWTYNKLTVEGNPSLLGELRSAVSGVSDEGELLSLSLQAIDPMPPEYKDGASWGDSQEFATLLEALKATPEGQRTTFIRANRGLSFEMFARADGAPPPEGWLGWRYQHWGTRRELTAETTLERNEGGTAAVFEFGK